MWSGTTERAIGRVSLRLVAELELDDHVRFVDGFADIAEIARLLAGTAIYLTPYRSREQIVSGALTFAVAAGCPVVSTPYFYAEDLLASGAGVLVPFEDPDAMSTAVLDLLDDPARLASARIESRRIGSGLAWSQVAIDTLEVLREATEIHERREHYPPETMLAGPWPTPKLDHLLTLVDDVGILEHAWGTVPVLGGGYCVDDVARLAVVSSGLLRERSRCPTTIRAGAGCSPGRSPSLSTPTTRPTAALHNILGYDRRWADEPHDGDHLGRTVWALGAVLADQPGPELTGAAARLLADVGRRPWRPPCRRAPSPTG